MLAGHGMNRKLSVMASGLRWAFPCGKWQPTEKEWTLSASVIQPEEKDRIGKFVFQKDAKSAMAGRLLLRKAVCDSLNLRWNHIKLERTEKGKPYLVNQVSSDLSKFNFNVSHQGDYAVLAAEPCNLVGIDVMKVETRAGGNLQLFFNTMARQFTFDEWKLIKSTANEHEQLCRFYRFWCLKESYVKALGIGIGFDLQRVSFNTPTLTLTPGVVVTDTEVYVDEEKQNDWILEETKLDEEHFVAVAQQIRSKDESQPRSSGLPGAFKVLNFDELTENAKHLSAIDIPYWMNFDAKLEKPNRR